MTEEEAKTRWCPMAMNNACTRNQPSEVRPMIPDAAKCIASDCMMWRWSDFVAKAKVGDFEVDVETDAKSFVDGYCGLGGKP